MVNITFNQKSYDIKDGETVLECLHRNGVECASSCKAGACLTCIKQCTEGDIPINSQEILKPAYKELNYFLPCICQPESPISFKNINTFDSNFEATITKIDHITDSIVILRILPKSQFTCKPGQYISITIPDGTSRSYSIANDPNKDSYIELHIRKIPHGKVSTWAYEKAEIGQVIHIIGPSGECFYLEKDKERSIILVGTGTGLAPLYAIANDALNQNHIGTITLIHGALNQNGIYYEDVLRKMATQFSNFHYIACVVERSSNPHHINGNITDMVNQNLDTPHQTEAFICGDPKLVADISQSVFISGLSHNNIHSDAFIIGENRQL